MKRFFFPITLIFFFVNLVGCSAMILAFEEREPDQSVFQLGAARQDVEKVLGKPIDECKTNVNSRVCAYEYNFSCDDARDGIERTFIATESVLYDIESLFLMELFSTPYFLITCGREAEIFVTYDDDDKVIASIIKKP